MNEGGQAAGRRRRWTFRLAAVVGAPLLVLGALELALRLGGFGHATSFTTSCELRGVPARCDNPEFSRTYFPRALARPPIPFVFAEEKPEETHRIFVVGASAAQGDPDPTFGPARILELLLKHRFPDRRFEVINAAVTAINSHVVLSIVRELVEYDPDLLIVYLGNNEVVGPYGAGTVFSPISRSWWMIRTSILVRRTRIGQLLAHLAESAEPRSADWRGMEMFVGREVPRDDPRMRTVYAHFARNLEAIVDRAADAGTPVLLSTVATNIADCAPFGSAERAGITEEARAVRERASREGERQLAAGETAAALTAYLEGAEIDPADAELRYRIGQVYRSLGRPEQAAEALTAARDLDTLRFRADTPINREIRRVAETSTAEQVGLAEVEDRFRDASPLGLPGRQLFYEHVHPTFAGNYLIALSWIDEIPQLLPRLAGVPERPLPDQEELERRLAFTSFDRRRVWSSVAARLLRPPFTGQLDHDDQLLRLEAEVARSQPTDWPAVLEIYERAIAAWPEDPWLLYNRSAVLSATGSHAWAAIELQRFLEVYPRDPSARERLCQTRVEEGRFEDALVECGRLTERLPDYTPPYYTMAYALAKLARFDEAVDLYRELLRREPEAAPQILNEIGRIELHRERPDRAIAFYREAIEAAEHRPEQPIPDIRFNYAAALRAARRDEEARRQLEGAIADYRRVVERDPQAIPPRLALARSLAGAGRKAEAIAELRRVVEIDPGNAEARAALAGLTRANGP